MAGQLVSQPITLATDYALGLTALAGAILLARKRRGPGSLPLRLWAAGFASVGAAAFLGGTWAPFSHDDLYHSIEIGALLLLYRGGLLLEPLGPA